jgi:hypothetical protein
MGQTSSKLWNQNLNRILSQQTFQPSASIGSANYCLCKKSLHKLHLLQLFDKFSGKLYQRDPEKSENIRNLLSKAIEGY